MGLHLGAEMTADIWQYLEKPIGSQLKQETISEAVKATPAVAGTIYTSLTLNEWVALATLLYIFIQAVILLRKHLWEVQDRKRAQHASKD
jgi:hypothetical protein|nr:MAG TPA: holin [Caudoviricetes sp.]